MQNHCQGALFVLSAPSGAGKTTVRKRLQCENLVRVSVSHTTRELRPTESPDKDYFFIHHGEFIARQQAGEFLEWAEVYGNLYGTSHTWVKQQIAAGQNVLLEIDCQGAMQVRQKMPAAVLLFLRPSNPETLRERLVGRGEDSPANIEKRFLAAKAEIAQEHLFDYVIINDCLETALQQIRIIIKKHKQSENNH